MGKASSAKKVARAARAGGTRHSGQRRPIGFPLAVTLVVVLGLTLVVSARSSRNAGATPRVGDHFHAAYNLYTCVVEGSDGSESTTPTTVVGDDDVPGIMHPSLLDGPTDPLGVHTHDDAVIHVHPYVLSVAGRKSTLAKFAEQVGLTINDREIVLPDGTRYKEGETKCQGGVDGVVQVAVWDSAYDAADGKKPNRIVTSDVGSIHLANGLAVTIAFMPEGSQIPVDTDVAANLEALGAIDGGSSFSTDASNSSSGEDSSSNSEGSDATTTTLGSASDEPEAPASSDGETPPSSP